MNNTFNIDSPYLQHYGVLGMKWGIRRYQNPDGTLTALGRKRVQKAMKARDILMTTKDKREHNQAEKEFRRITSKLYPAEMQNLISRVEADETLRKLSQIEQEDKILKGMQYADNAIKLIGNTAATVGNFVSIARGINDINSNTSRMAIERQRFDLEKEEKERNAKLKEETKELVIKKMKLDNKKLDADIEATKNKIKDAKDLKKQVKELKKENEELISKMENPYGSDISWFDLNDYYTVEMTKQKLKDLI